MIDMSHLNDDKSNGIKLDTPRDISQEQKEKDAQTLRNIGKQYEEEHVKDLEQRVTQLTAMCYTLARRLRNESFADNITAVQRQQMAEMAMQSLQMTPQVWELIHKSEEAQQQSS
jgi:hypothetical protein